MYAIELEEKYSIVQKGRSGWFDLPTITFNMPAIFSNFLQNWFVLHKQLSIGTKIPLGYTYLLPKYIENFFKTSSMFYVIKTKS